MEHQIKNSRESQIRSALSDVFTLLGLSSNEMPYDDGQRILVNFIQKSFPNIFISDINDSFVLAIKKTFEVDLSLYGRVFNSEYFARVMNGYLEYKRSLPSKQPEPPKQLQDGRSKAEREDAMLKVHEKLTVELNKIPEPIDILNCFASLHRNKKLDYSEDTLSKIKKQAADNVQASIDYLIRKGRTGEAKSARLEKKDLVYLEIKKLYVITHLQTLLTN